MTKVGMIPADCRNFRRAARRAGEIRYIVLHSAAGEGSARQQAERAAGYAAGVSAHYYVDGQAVWQSVADRDVAWHCGTRGAYAHPYCRNGNSIGVALCGRMQDGRQTFLPETVRRAQALVRRLMARYGIPAENVLRHYDVTHKTCPAPFVESDARWAAFCAGLDGPAAGGQSKGRRRSASGAKRQK